MNARARSFFVRLAPVAALMAAPVVAWAAIPGTCTTATPAATHVFGNGPDAWNTVRSPAPPYGSAGCDGCFLVEYSGTGGKNFDAAARYADAVSKLNEASCKATKVTAVAWGLKGSTWEIIGPEKVASGLWTGNGCTAPVASLGRVTGSSYAKVRIAARATRPDANGKTVAMKTSTELKDRSFPD